MFEWVLLLLAISLFLVTLPGTVELTILTIGGFFPKRPVSRLLPDTRDIRLAAIIPVYNEEAGLARTVRSLAACDNPLPLSDIVVMACNTTDGTVGVARQLGCTVIERIDPSRRGKGYGLNYAFQRLTDLGYDAYLIVDADTTVERNFLDEFRLLFGRGAEAGQTILRVANPQSSQRTRLMNIAFLAFTFMRPLARHRLRLSSGIFGNGFGVRASTVAEVPYECFSIAEDLQYHARLVRAGKRVEFLPETTVRTEMCLQAAQAKPQRERWEGGRVRVLIDEAPELALDMLRRPRFATFETLLDLLLLPLAYQAFLLCVLAIIGTAPLAIYAIVGLLLILAHVGQAMFLGGAERSDLRAFSGIPLYLGWKLMNLGGILKASKKSTPWNRTERGVGSGTISKH